MTSKLKTYKTLAISYFYGDFIQLYTTILQVRKSVQGTTNSAVLPAGGGTTPILAGG